MLNNNSNELNRMATEVLKDYGFHPDSITIIQSSSIKTVWKIKADGRILCLKRLKQTYDKALFSVHAQMYIKKSGGNVPGILLDKSQNPIVTYQQQLFVLYEWIEGKDLDFRNPASLQAAIQGLAMFHKASKGYKPPADARISSKIGKWPEQYESMKNRLVDWKELCKDNPSTSCRSGYLKPIDAVLEMCDTAVQLLGQSCYKELCSQPLENYNLCHQDYGKGNALLTSEGVYVLDLDGVTYDFAARDLRKMIGKLAETQGQWNLPTLSGPIEWYLRVNPLSAGERALIYIDLIFPHWFFGLVKNQFQNNKALKSAEIEKIAALEISKLPLLKSILKKEELT